MIWYTTEKRHDILHSDCELKNFLSFTNKHDFSLELFSNPVIC